MIKSFILNHRTGFSKCLGAVFFFFLLVCDSIWRIHYPVVGQALSLFGWGLVGIGALGRIWCAVYIAGYKNETLVTSGPYSLCRNPLYFFSMAGAVGVGLATETLLIPAMVLLFFAIYYPDVIQKEEDRRKNRHPLAYLNYFEKVPAFIPRFGRLNEPATYVVNPVIFKRHLMDAIWFIWLCGLISVLTRLHSVGILPQWIILF